MILMYHKVDIVTPTMWWVTPSDLRSQIGDLKERTFVYLEDYVSPDRQAVITFDDAYENVYRHALPILSEHNVPFEVFVIGDRIGGSNDWDRYEPLTRHMDLSQLDGIVQRGGRLQWHTRTHPELPDLSDEEIEAEMTVPADLKRRFPPPNFGWFSYPGGSLDRRSLDVARRNFSGAVSVFQGLPDDRWQLNRLQIERGFQTGTRIDDLPLWCGKQDDAGVNESPEWRDWTRQETTPDQQRIEDFLAEEEIRGSAILHVGVGNSSLASRFHRSAAAIDGITIEENEVRHAGALRFSNYRVFRANKYDSSLAHTLNRTYDLIVDNNPTTFCCCRRHLTTMLANYAGMLKPKGRVVTDKVGLSWASSPNDVRWGVSVPEWFALAAPFALTGIQYTDFVVGLRKDSGS